MVADLHAVAFADSTPNNSILARIRFDKPLKLLVYIRRHLSKAAVVKTYPVPEG